MKILDLEECSELREIETNICVIGSGPAGGIVAAHLSRKNIDVLLLEAGDELSDYGSDSIAQTNVISNVANLRFGWSKQFGGSSNLWAGRMCPLEEIDFKKRDWIPDSGWPFSASVLESYYKQAAEILDIPGYQYFTNYDSIDQKQNAFCSLLSTSTGLEAKCFQWAKARIIVSNYLKDVIKHHNSLRFF